MAYETRDNSGAIFRNTKKTEENHPSATGKCMVGGVMYYISSWTKTQQNGDKWQSLSFKPVDEQKRAAPKEPQDVFNMKDDDTFF